MSMAYSIHKRIGEYIPHLRNNFRKTYSSTCGSTQSVLLVSGQEDSDDSRQYLRRNLKISS